MLEELMKAIALIALLSMMLIPAHAGQQEPLIDISIRLETMSAINHGVAFLLDNQKDNGSFSSHPGITAMAIIALAESPLNGEDVVKKSIARARDYVLGQINEEGAVSMSAVGQDVYSTATCLMALAVLKNPADQKAISKLRKWLIKNQYKKAGGFNYGGPTQAVAGYPDLSNTHWALEALTLTPGNEMENEYNVLKLKLATFITSCQVTDDNAGSAKGGFLYYPVDQHEKKKGYQNLDKVWGSLTMGALKSLLFSGVKADDKRIVNGLEWTRTNYTMKENHGWDQGGWFYYTYMFSSAMLFLGQDYISTPEGKKLNWRNDLLNELLSRQRNGDHWENIHSKMWMEADANLCTAYALKAAYLALKEQRK